MKHTNLLNPSSTIENGDTNMNAYIGSSIHTATIHQNQPAFLMAPKIVSEGKYPGPSGKQVPARKVPLNATLPTNSSVTGDRATLSSGSGHSVGIRGGIGTGVGIREETEGGGVGRVSGKGMGMGAGVLMRSFCLANSEASRAAVDVPRHHTVRAPKMPLNRLATRLTVFQTWGTASISVVQRSA